jgi:hypothetical protein
VEMLEERNPKIVLALKSKKFKDLDLRNVLLLDNQSTFDLCCNKRFTSKIFGATNALTMTSNGGGLRITKKCKIPGYKSGSARRQLPTLFASRISSSVTG